MSETVKALGLSCCVFLLIATCFVLPISMIVIDTSAAEITCQLPDIENYPGLVDHAITNEIKVRMYNNKCYPWDNIECIIAKRGAKYKDDCPIEHKIPIWLIVSGVVALFQGLFAPAFRNDGKSERNSGRGIFQAVGLIINIFQMVWLIIGSVWVYGNYEPSYNEADDHMFCNETVYLFSFWILNVTYIGLCITLFISIGIFLYNRGLSGDSSY